jgi:hypothetical protein
VKAKAAMNRRHSKRWRGKQAAIEPRLTFAMGVTENSVKNRTMAASASS